MTVHLLKMCVGIDSVRDLKKAQARRLKVMRERGEQPVLRHWTRNMPRRAEEVSDGGSLYWIIKGAIRVRQPITAIELADHADSGKKCALVLSPDLIETLPVPARPMQGWRYLPAPDAPPDLGSVRRADGLEEMPEEMAEELRGLGLI